MVPIIFPLMLRTIFIAQMLSSGGQLLHIQPFDCVAIA